MSIKWNQRNVEFTGITRTDVLWKDANIEHWRGIHKDLSYRLKYFAKLELAGQAAVMAKVIYKHCNQMGRDRSFQYFKKVCTLVQRFNHEAISVKLQNYIDVILPLLDTTLVSQYVTMPTEEYTVYLTERLLGVSKLLVHILLCCQKAFVSLDSHMRLGFFVSFNMFAIATVSRIWSVGLELKERLVPIYDTFVKAWQNLRRTEKLMLPKTLEDWVGEEFGHVAVKQVTRRMEDRLTNFHDSNEEAHAHESTHEMLEIGEPVSWEMFTMERTSGKCATTKRKNPWRRCPICGRKVRSFVPNLKKAFKRNFRRTIRVDDSLNVLESDKKLKRWARLFSLKHMLLHATGLDLTRRLFLGYRQLQKVVQTR